MGKYVFSEDGSRFDAYDQIEIDERLERKSDTGHTHAYSAITGKPTTFPPSTHNHDDRYYTESEVNTKLANYKIKGDIVTLTGTASIAQGQYSGIKTWSYPSGFNRNNCTIISAMAANSTGDFVYNSFVGSEYTGVLRSNDVMMKVELPAQAGSAANYSVKLVLMKI